MEYSIEQNKAHYNNQYKNISIDALALVLKNYDSYLEGAIRTDISWVGMYYGDFKNQLIGKTVLELGCGDCMNVAIMAALGAKVIANDIADRSGEIIRKLNASFKFNYPIEFVSGDLTKANISNNSFDFVIGKAFLHHLTLQHEKKILTIVHRILKPNGQARFFEPAINSKLLDDIRWAIPVKDRPSKLFSPKAFKNWEERDPHPKRDNSSRHFKEIGKLFFEEVSIVPLGVLERFYRILPRTKDKNGAFKRKALKIEAYLPHFMKYFGARSQTVIYTKPKR